MQQWEATSRGGEWLYRAAVGDIDAEQAWRYDLNETGQGGYTKPSGSNGKNLLILIWSSQPLPHAYKLITDKTPMHKLIKRN